MPELMGLDVGQGCRVATLEEALDICRGEEGRVGVCSFDPELLKKVSGAGSNLRMGLIVDAPPQGSVEVLGDLGCEVLGLRAPHITASLVADVQASGRMVFGWGVEDVSGVDRLMGLGVDGVVTDFPDVVRGRVGDG